MLTNAAFVWSKSKNSNIKVKLYSKNYYMVKYYTI